MIKKSKNSLASIIMTLFLFIPQISYSAQEIHKPLKLNDTQLYNYISEKKSPTPFFEMGSNYLSNKLIDIDYKKATEWLLKSSQLENNGNADYLLAELYIKGLNTENNIIDIKKAEYFYKKAAREGNAEAKLKLAVNLIYNESMLNQNAGYSLINDLAKEKNKTGILLKSLLSTSKDNAKTLVIFQDYLNKKADMGDPDASFILGFMYFTNKGVPQDLEKAKNYFLLSLRNGNIVAEIFVNQIDKIENTLNKKIEKKEKDD